VTFEIIAPFKRDFFRTLSKYKNVKLRGYKTHKEIINIMPTFNLAIIPFLKNRITDLVNPLKLYEYSSACIPVVAIKTKELEHYCEQIFLADNHEQFIEMVKKILKCKSDHAHLKKFASENTWHKRVDKLLEKVFE
jgi:teichuronic acid biosynthesis glycosyltransferase TuaH